MACLVTSGRTDACKSFIGGLKNIFVANYVADAFTIASGEAPALNKEVLSPKNNKNNKNSYDCKYCLVLITRIRDWKQLSSNCHCHISWAPKLGNEVFADI